MSEYRLEIYIFLNVVIDGANIKGTLQIKTLHTDKALHNFKGALFLHIAAMLRHIEVTFKKILVSEFSLKKNLNLSTKNHLRVDIIEGAIIKGTLQFNNHI